jgi:alpha-tubulin suppressor-like RCC1 family protein
VYVVGANDYGQLGLGSTAMSIYTFTQILPNAPKIVRIACHLSNATAIVTEDNRLYVTGKNEEGHLCLGHNHDENTFQEVNLPDKDMRKLLLINVGHSHTFFMLGSLFERRPKMERLNYTNPFQDVEIK